MVLKLVLEHYRGKADRDLAQAGAPIYLGQLLNPLLE